MLPQLDQSASSLGFTETEACRRKWFFTLLPRCWEDETVLTVSGSGLSQQVKVISRSEGSSREVQRGGEAGRERSLAVGVWFSCSEGTPLSVVFYQLVGSISLSLCFEALQPTNALLEPSSSNTQILFCFVR